MNKLNSPLPDLHVDQHEASHQIMCFSKFCNAISVQKCVLQGGNVYKYIGWQIDQQTDRHGNALKSIQKCILLWVGGGG